MPACPKRDKKVDLWNTELGGRIGDMSSGVPGQARATLSGANINELTISGRCGHLGWGVGEGSTYAATLIGLRLRVIERACSVSVLKLQGWREGVRRMYCLRNCPHKSM